MKTAYDVCSYWGTANNDVQTLKYAAYIKERFLDKGLQGMVGGEGFYKYPNPAYSTHDSFWHLAGYGPPGVAESSIL